jgi:hypothetical protein
MLGIRLVECLLTIGTILILMFMIYAMNTCFLGLSVLRCISVSTKRSPYKKLFRGYLGPIRTKVKSRAMIHTDKIGPLGYCVLVATSTLRHVISRASFIIAIISVITGAAIWLLPDFGMTVDASGLIAMIKSPSFYALLVALILLFNLVCAQYWIWVEERQARAIAEAQISEILATRAQLSIDDPYPVPSPYGFISWMMKVHNEGASATNVHLNLCDIYPRLNSPYWDANYPYPIIQVGRVLDSNECHIHRGGVAIFELIQIWPVENDGILTSLNTRMPGNNQVKIERNAQWKMTYKLTAGTAEALEFTLLMDTRGDDLKVTKSDP